MKYLFMVLTLVGIMLIKNDPAYALIDFTGIEAWHSDDVGWTPESSGGALGGPAGMNNLGGAYQFIVDESTRTKFLNFDATVFNWDDLGGWETIHFDFNIYNQTQFRELGPVPTGDPVFTVPTKLTDAKTQDRTYIDKRIPFRTTFQPGTYWLAQEVAHSGDGPLTYISDHQFETLTNPEPTSLLLWV